MTGGAPSEEVMNTKVWKYEHDHRREKVTDAQLQGEFRHEHCQLRNSNQGTVDINDKGRIF